MTENIAQGTFTYVARGIASVLITPVFICAAYDPQGEDDSIRLSCEYSALILRNHGRIYKDDQLRSIVAEGL